ncbi:MAG: 30S ribosomal protein S5 [Candidatus Vogelbacteria bacterium]|nr:30S ribosomal protein S5 [Candidatus Vogelbacteria bacterium]
METEQVKEQQSAVTGAASRRQRNSSAHGQLGGNRRPTRRRGPDRGDRPAPEFAQKILGIRRVARVVAGGRRFSFSVALVLGDKQGRVGVGLGKAGDTSLAIDKATKSAKRAMIKVPLTTDRSIRTESEAKYAASRVFLKPARGRGLVAGSAVRSVLDLAGITDVDAKVLSRSKNQLNNARAALKALARL